MLPICHTGGQSQDADQTVAPTTGLTCQELRHRVPRSSTTPASTHHVSELSERMLNSVSRVRPRSASYDAVHTGGGVCTRVQTGKRPSGHARVETLKVSQEAGTTPEPWSQPEAGQCPEVGKHESRATVTHVWKQEGYE